MIFLFLLFIFSSIYPTLSNTLFDIQDTLTILCNQFPLISTINDSSLQCARLRIDENIPSSEFNLNNPTQLILFIIIDQSLSNISFVNITINFNQLSSSINEIRLGLLVIHSNFTLNNQITPIYSSYDIPILYWKNSIPNTYNLIDLFQLENHEYGTDLSMCRWNADRWNRLFNDSSLTNLSYVYFLKTTNTELKFTLIDIKNQSSLSPYLNILYCIPYKLGTTELVLIIGFGVLFILVVVILSVLHYFKGEDNRIKRETQEKSNKNQYRKSASMSSIQHNDKTVD